MGTIKEKTVSVLSFNDIPLHQESAKLIEEIMGLYKEVKHDDMKVISYPLVHLYPLKDTMNKDGELEGFSDALFFETKIFDPKSRTYSVSVNDSVDASNAKVKRIMIFKDGSTMIEFDGEYRFSNLTTLTAYKPKKDQVEPSIEPELPFD